MMKLKPGNFVPLLAALITTGLVVVGVCFALHSGDGRRTTPASVKSRIAEESPSPTIGKIEESAASRSEVHQGEVVVSSDGDGTPIPELSAEDRLFVEGILSARERSFWDNLQKLYANGESGLRFEREEARLLLRLAEVQAMRSAYEAGQVQVLAFGEVVRCNVDMNNGYVTTCKDLDNKRNFVFPVDCDVNPRVADCRVRMEALDEFALTEAMMAFNGRPIGERVEAARQDQELRMQIRVMHRKLNELGRSMRTSEVSEEERGQIQQAIMQLLREKSKAMRALLPIAVDPASPEMLHR